MATTIETKEASVPRGIRGASGEAIHGEVAPGFEGVRAAFARNFARHREIGAALSVYHRGREVVHLWGGIRDREARAPWQEDTMGLVFSTTKGLASLTLALIAIGLLIAFLRHIAEAPLPKEALHDGHNDRKQTGTGSERYPRRER